LQWKALPPSPMKPGDAWLEYVVPVPGIVAPARPGAQENVDSGRIMTPEKAPQFRYRNPRPRLTPKPVGRGEGDNLFSLVSLNRRECSINRKDGLLFQDFAHDMHELGFGKQTAGGWSMYVRGQAAGSCASTAGSRNGYFFRVDRVTVSTSHHQPVRQRITKLVGK